MDSATNQSDRKTLNNLVDKLLKLQKEPPARLKAISPRGPPKVKRRELLPEKPVAACTPNNKKIEPATKKFKPLKVTTKRQEKNKKGSLCDSKHDVVMPSYEKIMADIKKYDEHKAMIMKLEKFDESIFNKPIPNDCLLPNKVSNLKALDCKHLSFEQLKASFHSHKDLLWEIFTGTRYHKSHELFEMMGHRHKANVNAGATFLALTQEQIDYLMDQLRAEFDPENNKLLYFFQVLLPHLCLLIFMDEHEMSEEEANLYFDKMPIDKLCSLPDY